MPGCRSRSPMTLGMGAVVGLCNGIGIAVFGVPGGRDDAGDERRAGRA